MNSETSNGKAALLAIVASAVLSLIDNFVAVVVEEIGLWQFQVMRATIGLPLLLLLAKLLRQCIRPVSFKATAARSLVVSFGLILYFASLGMLPVPQAGAGLFSAPLWIVLLSATIFATRTTGPQIASICLGFVGVLLLLQPDFSSVSLATVLPLCAGAFYGLGMLLTPHLCRQEHPLTLAVGLFVSLGLFCLLLLAAFTIFPFAEPDFLTRGLTPISAHVFGLTLLQAVGAIVAVSLIAHAYRIGSPSLVSVSEYSFLVFATLWAYLIWNLVPGQLALAGVVTIILSGVLLSLLQNASR